MHHYITKTKDALVMWQKPLVENTKNLNLKPSFSELSVRPTKKPFSDIFSR